jgi:hypothetical protein
VQIALVTPTRDRPEAFRLCEKYMARQTYKGPLKWLVVDDGDVPAKPTMGQMHIRRNPSTEKNTLPDNLLETIKHLNGIDAILFIEDDDWYAPTYVETTVSLLENYNLVGIRRQKFFNIKYRYWLVFSNEQHSGLFSTSMRTSLLERLSQICVAMKRTDDPFIDIQLWGNIGWDPYPPFTRSHLADHSHLAIGIKGMPGRGGLSNQHDRMDCGIPDPNFDVLKKWIGDEDAQEYIKIAGGICKS